MKTHKLWENSVISLLQVTTNEDGESLEENIEVRHASSINHIIEHQTWIKNRLQDNINSGLDLWNKRKKIFPHLEFCDSIEKQLQNIKNSNPIFQAIIKKLTEVEKMLLKIGHQVILISIVYLKQLPKVNPDYKNLRES